MNKWIAFWNILVKDMKTYYLKPPNISWGLIFPFAWMLMMFLRTGSAFSIQEVFPGIIAMSVLFGTTSMLAVTITFEKKSRSFERLLLAPISVEMLMLAKISGAVIFGLFNSIVPILISVIYFKAVVYSWLFLISGIFFLSFISTLFGLLISVSAKEVFEAQTYSNFFRFPMIFLCGLFAPVTVLPVFLRPFSFALPVTYGVDILRFALDKTNLFSVSFNILVLIVFCIVIFSVSIKKIKDKWLK